jgi:hypothetical protein
MTRKGVFFAGQQPPHYAAHLISGGRVHRLMKGLVRWPVTSPDGCKVAFSYAKSFEDGEFYYPGRGYRGRIIDLCADKEN